MIPCCNRRQLVFAVCGGVGCWSFFIDEQFRFELLYRTDVWSLGIDLFDFIRCNCVLLFHYFVIGRFSLFSGICSYIFKLRRRVRIGSDVTDFEPNQYMSLTRQFVLGTSPEVICSGLPVRLSRVFENIFAVDRWSKLCVLPVWLCCYMMIHDVRVIMTHNVRVMMTLDVRVIRTHDIWVPVIVRTFVSHSVDAVHLSVLPFFSWFFFIVLTNYWLLCYVELFLFPFVIC